MGLTPELKGRLEGISNLPSPPKVAMRIIELAQDPDPDIAAVAKAISLDPALTTKILRIANSALYSRRRKSENLRQALIVLGLNATLTLALSFSLVTSLKRDRTSKLDYGNYWRRTLLSATTCRTLGQRLGRFDIEELFLASLLQDIGMLVIDKGLPEAYADMDGAAGDHARIIALERERIGTDHAEVGAWLLESWNMPEFLQVTVGASHEPTDVPEGHEFANAARCVALSSRLADIWTSGDACEAVSNAAADLAEALLDLDRPAVGELLGEVRAQIPETEALYETDLVGGTQSESILDHAREVLMVRNLQVLHEVSTLRETAQTLESRTQELEEENRRDKLTGTFNRAYLDQRLAEEYRLAKENGWPISIMFADLDRFKLVNDTYGHQAGDTVLMNAAELLHECVRESDVVARYGGEEFVIILPGNKRTDARVVADRIVRAFQQAKHDVGPGGLTVTVSVGLATLDGQNQFESVEKLIEAADKAVYAAKIQGRNRVIVFGQEGDSEGTAAAG